MSPLEHALDVASRIRDALQAELVEARQQRVLIRQLDVQGLFERARRRGEFNVRLAESQNALGVALGESAAELGIERVTTDGLHASGHTLAKRLAQVLSELRASAQALQEIDGMNQIVAKRALACVRGYLSALSPRASVYDRHGSVRNEGAEPIARQVA
jgi:hypothetical protein